MFSSLNAKDVRETRSWKKDKPTPPGDILFVYFPKAEAASPPPYDFSPAGATSALGPRKHLSGKICSTCIIDLTGTELQDPENYRPWM
jgi:hypothetical protein